MTGAKTLFIKSIVTSLFLFFGSLVFASYVSAAPRLFFDPANYTSAKDKEFEVKIQIDAENRSVFSADAYIDFPANDLSISVVNGGFFPDSEFDSAQTSGKLEIHGYFFPSGSRSGNGTFAILKIKANKDVGSGNITFACSGEDRTVIIDSNGNNILSCGSLNQLSISYSVASDNNNGPGDAKSCGNSCQNNTDCKAGLFCNQGVCRNPICAGDSSCTCATPAPTARPPVRSGSPTPEVVTLTEFTPFPTTIPTESPDQDEEGGQETQLNTRSILGIAGLILLVLAAILFIVKRIKGKNKPPTPKTYIGTESHPPVPPLETPAPPPTPPTTY
jgi:hypothetical protein